MWRSILQLIGNLYTISLQIWGRDRECDRMALYFQTITKRFYGRYHHFFGT
jgi:hypothetical protein